MTALTRLRDGVSCHATMLQIVSITAPIYLIIAAGYLCVRQGVFSKADMRALGRFVVLMCVPAQLFLALSRRPLSEVIDGGYLLAYALASLALLLGTTFYAHRVRGWSMPRAAMFGLGVSSSNSVFIGFPIAQQVVGPHATVALALCVLVENLIIMPLAFVLADSSNTGQAWHRVLARSLTGLLKNPMILAILAGAACAALGVRLPDVPVRTVQMLGLAAGGTALFVVGGALFGLSLDGARTELTALAFGKLLLHPVLVWALLVVLRPIDPALATAAVIFAAMPTFSIYPVLAQKYGLEGRCAAALLVATMASFVTVALVLGLLGEFGSTGV